MDQEQNKNFLLVDKLKQHITDAINDKPEKHEFDLNEEPQIVRFMNMTGG